MAKRILIADDSLTIQRAFGMTFGAEDFALTMARSADEGLGLARQTRPDLVIADATMPGRSGYELCAAIKADAGLRPIPVFILASAQQPYDEAKGQQVGADGHLVKPWESSVLIDRVRDMIAKGGGVPARPVPMAVPGRATGSALPAAALSDEYGDIDMDAPRETSREIPRQTASSMPAMPAAAPAHAPPLASHAPAHAPAHAPVHTATSAAPPRSTAHSMPALGHAPPSSSASPAGGTMRPSLIPGVRPGAVPPARPGSSVARPLGSGPLPTAAVPPRPATPNVGRTLVGLPAANMPIPGSTRSAPTSVPPSMTSPLARPPTGPVSTLAARPLAAPAPAPLAAHAPAVHAAVSSAVEQKMASIAARGPEYEALAKLSREVIEQIVWEIVPELAEVIIREHVAKHGGRM